MPGIVTLSTDRLRLRDWQDSDRERFASINADPEVMEFFPSILSRPQSDAMVERIQAGFSERGWGLWAVEVTCVLPKSADQFGQSSSNPAPGEFIGYVGLAVPRFEAHFTPCVEIGWRLARHAWGYGYATEAARAAIQFAFKHLKLNEVVSFTAISNVRSRQVMQRLGMSCNVGDEFDHPALPRDHPLCRHVLFRLRNPNVGDS